MTDFEVDIQAQAPVIESDQTSDRFRVRLEREMRGSVGGGGPEMYFKTRLGDIIIRSR